MSGGGIRSLIDCLLGNTVPTCYAVVNNVEVPLESQSYVYDGAVHVTGILRLNAGDLVSGFVCRYGGVDVFVFDYYLYSTASVPYAVFIDVDVRDGGNKPSRIAVLDRCATATSCYSYDVDVTSGSCKAFVVSVPFGGRLSFDCGLCVDGMCYGDNTSIQLDPGAHVVEYRGPAYGDVVVSVPCRLTVGAVTYNITLRRWGII